MYKDSRTVVKGKYPRGQSNKYSAGAGSEFVFHVPIPNVAILLRWYTATVTWQPVHLEWHNCARCSAKSLSFYFKEGVFVSARTNVMKP